MLQAQLEAIDGFAGKQASRQAGKQATRDAIRAVIVNFLYNDSTDPQPSCRPEKVDLKTAAIFAQMFVHSRTDFHPSQFVRRHRAQ